MKTNVTSFEVVVKPKQITIGDYKGFNLKQGMITFSDDQNEIVNVISFDAPKRVITIFTPADGNFEQKFTGASLLQFMQDENARKLYEEALQAKERFTQSIKFEKAFNELKSIKPQKRAGANFKVKLAGKTLWLNHTMVIPTGIPGLFETYPTQAVGDECPDVSNSMEEHEFIVLTKQGAKKLNKKAYHVHLSNDEIQANNKISMLAANFEAVALDAINLPLEDRAFLTRTIEIPDLRSTKRFENEGVGELRRRFVPTKIIGVFQSYLVANGKEFETDDPIYAKCHTIITKDMLQELEAIDKDIYL